MDSLSKKKYRFDPKRKPCLIWFVLFILYCLSGNSQPSYNLPRVISPSPQSEALTKYGDYPMADYTGLVDVTIPMHTITGKRLSLPMTVSFHASGRMANETNGTLGIRWTLNCGGLITRTSKGLPDEWERITPHIIDPNITPDFDTLYSSCPQGKDPYVYNIYSPRIPPPVFDTEFDVFNYVLPSGKSGHFILKNQNGAKVPMFIPYEPFKMEIVKDGSSNNYIQSISITDEDGTKYIFGKIDASSANSVEKKQDVILLENMLPGATPTAWYLTKVISSDGSDEITFSYNTRFVYSASSTQSTNVADRVRNSSTTFDSQNGDPYEENLKEFIVAYHLEQGPVINQLNEIQNIVPTLSTIQFNGGSISFNYTQVPVGDNNTFLSEIIINRENSPYKKIKFNLTKHAGEADIFYLDNLSFYGENGSQVNDKYSFTYYEPSVNDFIQPLQASASNKDWWGYYTHLAGGNLLPLQNIGVSPYNNPGLPNNLNIGYSNIARDPNEYDEKQYGMLKSITYPTGGQTEFIYEGNRYDYYTYPQPDQPPATLEGPGIRIKEVVSKPVTGNNLRKIYKYGINEDGKGYINELLRPGSATRKDLSVAEGNVMHFWTWDRWGSPADLDEQAGYRNRDYFSDPYINFDFSGSPIKYDAVTEYYAGSNNVLQQKTQNRYSWGNNEQVSDFIVTDHDEYITNTRKFSNPQNAWLKPVLTGKSYYKYSNGQFDLVKKESYEYEGGIIDEAWDMPTYLHTSAVWALRNPDGSPNVNAHTRYTKIKDYDANSCSIYGYGFRRYTTGAQSLLYNITEEYTSNGMVKSEKYLDYNTSKLIKKEKFIGSKKDTIIKTYTYPQDYPGVLVYQQMMEKNILSPVVEQGNSINGTQTKTLITSYSSPYPGIFAPQLVEFQKSTGPRSAWAVFNKYDLNGNILEQQKANDSKEVYLWGYRSKYPVAKIIGQKSYTDIIAQSGIDTAYLNGLTDEITIRSYLNVLRSISNVQVFTYSYKSLVGIASETDPSGRTTYYEYDIFGRLSMIKDNQGKIVKKICYNYAGQQVDCSQ